MDVRFIIITFLFFIYPAQADIYKCTVNGKTVFSDQVCAENAEKIEIKVYKPSDDEVAKQREATKNHDNQARINEIASLKEKNDSLRHKITQLEREKQVELQRLGKGIYRHSETTVATHEYGLFQKMAAVEQDYQQKTAQINAEISRNENRLNSLY